MKTLTQKHISQFCVTALFTLLVVFAAGQNATQLIKITMTTNCNMPSQAPATLVLMFDNTGNDSLAYPDAGNEGTLGQFNDQVYPFSLTQDGFVVTNLDSRPALGSYRSIPFGFVTKSAGDIKVVASAVSTDSSTPAPGFVWLEQISTGERFSILDTAKFTLAANPNYQSDFILHVGPPASSVPTHETCSGNNDGAITVTGPNYNNFTLELYQNSSQVLNTTVAGTDTVINMSAGNYVSVIRINGIAVDSSDVIINAAAPLIADFLTDNNYVVAGETVNFTDNSTGGVNYTWDFGDGDTAYTVGSESHAFAVDGSYQVTLTVSDTNGCTATAFDFIEVNSTPPPIANNWFNNSSPMSIDEDDSFTAQPAINGDRNTENVVYSSDRILVDLGNTAAPEVTITAINGAVISSAVQTDVRAGYNVPAPGVYIVTIRYSNGTVVSHSVLAQ